MLSLVLRRHWRIQAHGDLGVLRIEIEKSGSAVLGSSYRTCLGIRTGTGIGTGFCGTSICFSSFFTRPSIGLAFIWRNETRAGRSAHSIQHKQKTPSTVWEGPDS